jgi:hypothetical protein
VKFVDPPTNFYGVSLNVTPLSPYPPSTLRNMEVCNMTDEAGNSDCQA